MQPLEKFRQPEMDHSFVGMTGGEIFHEMMLRHNVEHVCMYNTRRSDFSLGHVLTKRD